SRGVDDKQALVTFGRVFAEWQGLFSPLYPVATNSDAAVFNTGWINKVPASAGPFRLERLDPVRQTGTLARDPKGGGPPAKLDRIVFKVYERNALADGLANNEIDFYLIGSSIDLMRRAQSTAGAVIRESPERQYNHITFNGAPGAILADVRLRQAVAKGI